ncbi:MAG: hypothetical protein N838_02660 [Thiohalocapsa sp. PB-PSB1]|nr:MAG: hypothetical protein N838_02660 [Thiohalocapsa sp. PB-PSB1]
MDGIPARPGMVRRLGALLLAALAPLACVIGATDATAQQRLPAAQMQIAAPVAPVEAARILGERSPGPRRARADLSATVSTRATAASADADPPDPEITALARALGHDPDRIYQYVHDRIAFEPTYGLQKGALGTLLDRRGNAFDQAALLVALLRASDIAATFVHGELRLEPQPAADLLGVAPTSAAVGWALGSGGIPAQSWV